MQFEQIRENIAKCKYNVELAKKRGGVITDVSLIGAIKTQSQELVAFLNDSRLLSDVGENRVQELIDKYQFGDNLNWHMIGQLQTNKVKYIADKVVLIHYLDREALADEIQKQAEKRDLLLDCLIEVNMGSEISKGGIEEQNLTKLLDYVENKDNIRLRGLMTVMPNLSDTDKLKSLYERFRRLYEDFSLKASSRHIIDTLSCGMSNDYEIAIEYGGATAVRLGRVIFGERNYNVTDKT